MKQPTNKIQHLRSTLDGEDFDHFIEIWTKAEKGGFIDGAEISRGKTYIEALKNAEKRLLLLAKDCRRIIENDS